MGSGIPGLRGTEHIGFTVPNLQQAHDFFVDVIGCDYIYTLGPFSHPDPGDDWMREHMAVDPRTVMQELRFYRCGFGPNFEIFEFVPAESPAPQPLNSDLGGHHLAFYVDDMDAAVAYLRSYGVTVLGDPTASSSHSFGQRWVYFLTPWGMQCELVSYPGGKAYEKLAPVKLWNPANPAE
jgi:catechol 2,3-dioxygenase-like lactoylglutathione lyase family enzyme